MNPQFPALVGLGVALCLPAAAQMKCDGPQDVCQKIVDIGKQYDAASTKHDAAGVAALLTPDAVFVYEGPTVYGRDGIEKLYSDWIKAGLLGKHASGYDQVHVNGNTAWAIGSWSDTGSSDGSHPIHGNWGAVYMPEGGAWKARMLTANTIETPPGQAVTSPK